MAFNELNSVEHYIIYQLSGVNLNSNAVQDPKQGYGPQWVCKSANDLKHSVNEVLIEQDLKDALIRLNPEISAKPELAEEVIYKLRAISSLAPVFDWCLSSRSLQTTQKQFYK